MVMEGSFRSSGSVPFQWELRPGVPKSSLSPPIVSPEISKLAPPPFMSSPAISPSSYSSRPSAAIDCHDMFISSPERRRSHLTPTGCFPMPSPKWKDEKRKLTSSPLRRRSVSFSFSPFTKSPAPARNEMDVADCWFS